MVRLCSSDNYQPGDKLRVSANVGFSATVTTSARLTACAPMANWKSPKKKACWMNRRIIWKWLEWDVIEKIVS